MTNDKPAALGALHVNEGKLRGHVDEVVRSRVEETLNGLLDAEADEICGAQRYERSADVWTAEPATMIATWRPRLARSSSGSRGCVDCRLKLRSLSGTKGARPRLKRPWSKCIWRE